MRSLRIGTERKPPRDVVKGKCFVETGAAGSALETAVDLTAVDLTEGL